MEEWKPVNGEKSLCQLIRDDQPELEIDLSPMEKEYNITTNYEEWVDANDEHRVLLGEDFNHQLLYDIINLDEFKDVGVYLKHPVGIYNGIPIEAVSRKVTSDQEVIDFIKDNENIALYNYTLSYCAMPNKEPYRILRFAYLKPVSDTDGTR